jgi:Phage integrase family
VTPIKGVDQRRGTGRDTRRDTREKIMAQISLQKTPRLKLAVQKKPYWQQMTPGLSLGYRRNKGAGAWVVRVADGSGTNWTKGFAAADDITKPDGDTVMTYEQAQDRARKLAGVDRTVSTDRPITVTEAVDAYAADLETRGANPQNADSIRFYLKGHPALRATPVSLLKKADLKNWRDGLVINGRIKAANRVCRVFKAALNLAASYDERIINANAWKEGLKSLPSRDDNETSTKRDLILSDDTISAIVIDAYRFKDDDRGIWFQTLAETGARESQICRLQVADLQDDRNDPRLLMPSSRKGRNRQIDRKPVPISRQLAQRLRQHAVGKRSSEPLLIKLCHIEKMLREVNDSVGVGREYVPYSFRHSSIVRMLLKRVPLSVVSSHHDTSAKIIQKHYAHFINDVSDDLTRGTLVDFERPKSGKVVRIGRKVAA